MLWKTRDTYEGPRPALTTYRRGQDGRVMTPADLKQLADDFSASQGAGGSGRTPRIVEPRRRHAALLEVDVVNRVIDVIITAVIALGTTFAVIFAFHGLWLLSEAIYRAVGLR